ncbi:cytochrome P450 [Xylariomycetidae sp. FL0641]|nr:cytochrome P450 [Xylariomycetidae sp. FL0641]
MLLTALGAVPSIVLALWVALTSITILNLARRLFSRASLPASLPWASRGHGSGPLGRARANLASMLHLKEMLDEGYAKYSSRNQPYVLANYITGPQVMLPPSQLAWLLAQPDGAVLSQEAVNRQFLQSDHTFLGANAVRDPVHPDIVRGELTRHLGAFAAGLAEEAEHALRELWGDDAETWREVAVYDDALRLVARLSLRVFVGRPLCRHPAFLRACSAFVRKVVLAAAGISLFPGFLRPLVAPLFTLYDRLQYRRCAAILLPHIHARLDRLRDPSKAVDPAPNDYITWALTHALAKPTVNPTELSPPLLAARFAVLCFAAIQSSVITLTNVLFDIAASPTSASLQAALRDEVLVAATPDWGKAALARLARVDSALRESLRLHGFVERGVVKMVVAPGGVALPCGGGGGARLPPGAKVGVSAYSAHRDAANYGEDAARFDAFRFCGDADGDADGDGDGRKRQQGARCRLVDTGPTFMGFSHGAHACPGRFFAANQLKIALAHIALRYEIEPIPQRPVNKWFFGHIAPPLTEKLRVRRRKV